MTIPLVLFALAATGGLLLAYLRFSNKPLPLPLALGHGAIAAAGLVALILAVVRQGGPSQARIALFLFVAAALGGFALFSFQLRKKPLPAGIVVVHGLVAVVAFVVLLLGVMKAG